MTHIGIGKEESPDRDVPAVRYIRLRTRSKIRDWRWLWLRRREREHDLGMLKLEPFDRSDEVRSKPAP